MKWILALCLCAGLGCQATQSASMDPLPKWEYKIVLVWEADAYKSPSLDEWKAVENLFNRLGADEWQYVRPLSNNHTLFRRRKK